jgi:hypothetical protein
MHSFVAVVGIINKWTHFSTLLSCHSKQHNLRSGKKGKAVPQHTYGGAGVERMYSSYSFTTSVLDDGECSVSPWLCFTTGETYVVVASLNKVLTGEPK